MQLTTNKRNFTMGPVMMADPIKDIGAWDVPYFRTREFSGLMAENERLLREMFFADGRTRVVSLTGSGTAGMEAAVMNTLGMDDKVLLVNGGGFGERFVQICRRHRIPYEELCKQQGSGITPSDLEKYEGKGFTAFIVNHHETTSGVLYDLELIGNYCKRNNCFLVVDAISSFLADDLRMEEWGINVVVTGSQKAFAVPPGLSLIALDRKAVERVKQKECCSFYFDFKAYLKDGERGQTPFTPAVGILMQLNRRLNTIAATGIEKEKERVTELASHFREGIKNLPLTIASDSLSNAMTPLFVDTGTDAYEIFEILEDRYGIWVCPSGGELRKRMLRVGHIGDLTVEDNNVLIRALEDIFKKGAF